MKLRALFMAIVTATTPISAQEPTLANSEDISNLQGQIDGKEPLIGDGTLALNKLAQGGASANQTLSWNATLSAWAPATPAAGGNATVDLSSNQTLANKTLQNPTTSLVSLGNSTGNQTLSLSNGTILTATLTGNSTFTLPTPTAGKAFTLMLNSGAGNRTATFTNAKWPAGSAPTITATAGRLDILDFVSDGTDWFASARQNYTPTAGGAPPATEYTSLAIIGDSLSDFNYRVVGGTGLNTEHSWGRTQYPSWLQLYLPRKFVFVRNFYVGANASGSGSVFGKETFGVGGSTAKSIWDGRTTTETAGGTQTTSSPFQLGWMSNQIGNKTTTLALVCAGVNDIGLYNRSGETTAANVITLWDKLELENINFVPIAIPPGANATLSDRADIANTLLAAEAARRGLTWVPQPAGFRTGNTITPSYATDDLLHFSVLGAQKWAQHVASYIDSMLSSTPVWTIPESGAADWKSGNPYFTGGTTYATGWSSAGVAAGATMTASLVDDAEGRWQRIVISGATTPRTAQSILRQTGSILAQGADKWYRIVGRVRCSGGASASIVARSGGSAATGTAWTTASYTTFTPPESSEGFLMSAAFPYPTTAAANMTFTADGIIHGNGQVDFQSLGIIAVPAPY